MSFHLCFRSSFHVFFFLLSFTSLFLLHSFPPFSFSLSVHLECDGKCMACARRAIRPVCLGVGMGGLSLIYLQGEEAFTFRSLQAYLYIVFPAVLSALIWSTVESIVCSLTPRALQNIWPPSPIRSPMDPLTSNGQMSISRTTFLRNMCELNSNWL